MDGIERPRRGTADPDLPGSDAICLPVAPACHAGGRVRVPSTPPPAFARAQCARATVRCRAEAAQRRRRTPLHSLDLPQIELLVRVTARLSAAAFAAALIVFASRGFHRRRVHRAVHFLVAFILAHTIHFLAVVWLAVATQGENIQVRGGWVAALIVAGLFYASAFAVMRAWNGLASGRALSSGERLAAYGCVAVIALVFLNSYVARVASLPIYWLPTIGMIASVIDYFVRARLAFAARSAE
jgi:hypothetical protein